MSNNRSTAPYPRVRREYDYTRLGTGNTPVVSFGSTPGTYVNSSEPRMYGYRGTARRCFDVVTPGFAALQAKGAIINNHMLMISWVCDCGGRGPFVQYTGKTSPWPSGVRLTADHTSVQLHQNPDFLLPPILDAFGEITVHPGVSIDVGYLRRSAKTSALASVDQSDALGLVGVAELKKTLSSVVHPLSSIRQYIGRWKLKPTRRGKKLVIYDGKGLLPAITDQYLELYYGLIPMVRDIESYLQAYINSQANYVRKTARGQASDVYETDRVVLGDRTAAARNFSQFDLKYSIKEEVTVRSGLLYRPSPASLQKGLGLRWGDVLPSLYEAMPWSFFLDYFSNLGEVVEALTPRAGVSYLACWDTVDRTITWRAETLASFINGDFTHSRVGNEWASRVMHVRERLPTDQYSNVGLTTDFGTWNYKAKVAAVLSLVLQQVGSRVVPPAIWRA